MFSFLKIKYSLFLLLFVANNAMIFSQHSVEINKMYVVDTITMDNPIVFYKKNESGLFVGNKNEIERINFRKNKDFISEKNIFIYSSELYKHLSLEEIENYNYPDYGNCEFKKEYFKDIKGVVYRKFKNNPDKFMVGLINISFYDKKNTTFGLKPTVFRDLEKEMYYKIVFPICE